ncbi:Soluble lytic murein transglycosylase precursor [Caenispirillum salinarum AK4]|uniref:Soluble lytic murein transglycosylase n=1 Tax=Caenispirillum salinarum AK4 TaxID=1238182 RepID=K9GZH8_9PROT|nr:lytic transglycosylase domain-containing protein [Caenispirillum salinarum]EKV31405.1 Soluble lytic murein transglycosylase precursor [Caenispirillum salinarum AK4]
MVTSRTAPLRAGALALALAFMAPAAPAFAQTTAPVASDILSAADESAFSAAFAAAERGQWDEAFAQAEAADNPIVLKVLTWRRMLESGTGMSFQQISRFASDNPDWPWRSALLRRAEEAITLTDDPTQVFAWFQDKNPVTADGWIAKARAMELLNLNDNLTETVRRAWRTESFGSVQEKAFVAQFGGHLRDEDHLARLDHLLWERETEAARRMLRVVDAGHRALAQARIALMENKGGVDAAIDRVPAALKDDPGLVYDRLRWRRTHDMEDRAVELFDHPNADKVRPDLWWRERAILARDTLEAGRPQAAYDIISNHGAAEGYPLADAEFMSGWIALRFLDDPTRALPHFERLFTNVSTPISLGRGAYWAGRAEEAAGNIDAARTWYEKAAEHGTTYYGQLAAVKLGDDAPGLPDDPQPTAEDVAFLAESDLTAAARALAEIGRYDDVSPFIHQLQAEGRTPGQKHLATQLAVTLGQPHIGVAAARRAALDGVTLVETGYPVTRFNTADGIEEALVLSIIRQESNFNPDAVSRVGARGLMQLMPGTAEGEARKLSLGYDKGRLTDDPAYNVILGSTYLRDLIDGFDGSYIMAIAGYNAGPARSRQWAERFGDPRSGRVDPVDWVEMIPFSETRNYVQRVLEGLQVYRARLGETDRLAMKMKSDLMR